MKNPFAGLIAKLSRVIVRFSWLWIVLALALTVLFGWFTSKIRYEFSLEQMFLTNSPLKAVLEEFQDLFGKDDNLLIVGHGADDLFSAEGYERIKDLTEKFEALPYFDHVLSLTSAETMRGTGDGFEVAPMLTVSDPAKFDWAAKKAELLADPLVTGALLAKDGYATAISMEIKEKYSNNEGRKEIIDRVEELIAPYRDRGEWHLTGIPLLRNAFVAHMQQDQKIFLPLSTLVVNILAFWLFRTLRANALSNAIILLAVLWTVGAMSAGGGTLNIITVVMPSLIMVMGMSYVTHFLSRYIEDTGAGLDKPEAIDSTVRHMFLPILLTSFTTAIGFLSLLLLQVELVRQFGLYSAIGLAFCFWLTLTFLSALCLKIRPFEPERGLFHKNDIFGRYLKWNDRFVKKYPWPIIIFSFLMLVGSIYCITQVRVDNKLMEESNPKYPEFVAHQFMERHLSGIVPLEILVKADHEDAFKEPANLRALDELKQYIHGVDGVDYAFCFADVVKKMNQAMYGDDPARFVVPDTREAVAQYLLLYDGDQLERLVNGRFDRARIALRLQDLGSKRIRVLEDDLAAEAKKILPAGLTMTVTGSSIMIGKLMDRLILDMVKSLFTAALIITVLMTVLFRSVRLGLLAMIPNFIPILMTMGMLGLLDITLRTSIVVVFSISLGIAVDDTIHFITRCRDEYKKSGDYDVALSRTFEGTGRPIMFTSLLLFLGFFVLSVSSFIPTRNFGMLSAVTMVSALLGDIFLLPALLWVVKPKMK